jgi:hypothetical protein
MRLRRPLPQENLDHQQTTGQLPVDMYELDTDKLNAQVAHARTTLAAHNYQFVGKDSGAFAHNPH